MQKNVGTAVKNSHYFEESIIVENVEEYFVVNAQIFLLKANILKILKVRKKSDFVNIVLASAMKLYFQIKINNLYQIKITDHFDKEFINQVTSLNI